MWISLRKLLINLDTPLILAALVLSVIGLSTIQSTILAGVGFSSELFNRQVLALILGVSLFFLISRLDYRYLTFLAPLIYGMTIVLLVLLLSLGQTVRGSARWFVIGDFQLQVSEYAKIFLIVAWVAFLVWAKERINRPLILLFYFLLLLLPVGLIYLQPDLGTSVILILTGITMLLFSQIKPKNFTLCLLLFVLLVPLVWFLLKDYQKIRLLSFLNPTLDPLGAGYHILQSIIAVGSGGFLGRGWGRGTQSHLQFLPEQHTDFIFATFTEETGFLGAILLLFLFGIIFWRGIKISQNCPMLFGRLLGIGIVAFLFIQVFINIAMNLGIAPITGIPLPLVSYGGSSLLTTFISLGLLQSIANYSQT